MITESIGAVPSATLPTGSVLIDNSTYFSFKSLVEDGILDAPTLYNMTNFLECIVIAPEIVFAPTTRWKPSNTEPYFAAGGPGVSLEIECWSEQDLRKLFLEAIESCITDVADPSMQAMIACDDGQEVATIFKSWRELANSDPTEFMQTYSKPVMANDAGAASVLKRITERLDWNNLDSSLHVCQFLLRTNVCLVLAKGLSYHPHSHRVQYVAKKAQTDNRKAHSMALSLLHQAESQVNSKINLDIRKSVIGQFTNLSRLDPHVPLVLGTVLSNSNSADDLIKLTLQLRECKEARRYRSWLAKLSSISSPEDLNRAERELAEARIVLNNELQKLRGGKSDWSKGINGAIKTIGEKNILELNAYGVGKELLRHGLKSVGPISKWIGELQAKRKTILLVGLARQRRAVGDLQSHLLRVFKKQLDPNELIQLSKLRQTQINVIEEVSKTLGSAEKVRNKAGAGKRKIKDT